MNTDIIITVILILIYGGFSFFSGRFFSVKKPEVKVQRKNAMKEKEKRNFLNYDGSDQRR